VRGDNLLAALPLLLPEHALGVRRRPDGFAQHAFKAARDQGFHCFYFKGAIDARR
jgi:hypothetical protein